MNDLAHYAVFDRRPDDTYIEQWREHIKATGSPEAFDYVSMTRPYDMEGATLLSGDIDVPLDKREDEAMVPCPLCRPNSPKFKIGRMAWFPPDKTVLFIGNACAKRHMGREYHVADKRFKKEAAAKVLLEAWAEIQRRRSELIDFGNKMLPVAAVLEKAKKQFRAEAPEFLNFMHGEFVAKGGRIAKVEYTGYRNERGKKVYETRQIGTLVGSDFLLSYNSLQSIRSAIATLETAGKALPAWSPDDPDTSRLEDALAVGNKAVRAVHALRDARANLHDARQFIHENNIDLFQRWADMEESPFAMLNIRWKGSWLFLNVAAFFGAEKMGFQVAQELFSPLPSLETSKFDLPGFPFVSRIKGRI
ncbi:hypothetical protein N7379_06175 [Rhizobium pusense]|uniref:hypothetical protein n=1 Tax=Agrobacterium pusense TaxID=648995 RepID=UPI002449D91C|nr:hypothetical protein [Agrobacterium pusense]MDH0114059.1 hypothetical protein [Agrobacterium pusense]